MAKVVWKTIKGCGPYAYLQRSLRDGQNVRSEHIAYLGSCDRGLVPGEDYVLPREVQEKAGIISVHVPAIGMDVIVKLTDGSLERVQVALENAYDQPLAAMPIQIPDALPPAVAGLVHPVKAMGPQASFNNVVNALADNNFEAAQNLVDAMETQADTDVIWPPWITGAKNNIKNAVEKAKATATPSIASDSDAGFVIVKGLWVKPKSKAEELITDHGITLSNYEGAAALVKSKVLEGDVAGAVKVIVGGWESSGFEVTPLWEAYQAGAAEAQTAAKPKSLFAADRPDPPVLTVPEMHAAGIKAAHQGDVATAESMMGNIFAQSPGSSYGLEVMEAIGEAKKGDTAPAPASPPTYTEPNINAPLNDADMSLLPVLMHPSALPLSEQQAKDTGWLLQKLLTHEDYALAQQAINKLGASGFALQAENFTLLLDKAQGGEQHRLYTPMASVKVKPGSEAEALGSEAPVVHAEAVAKIQEQIHQGDLTGLTGATAGVSDLTAKGFSTLHIAKVLNEAKGNTGVATPGAATPTPTPTGEPSEAPNPDIDYWMQKANLTTIQKIILQTVKDGDLSGYRGHDAHEVAKVFAREGRGEIANYIMGRLVESGYAKNMDDMPVLKVMVLEALQGKEVTGKLTEADIESVSGLDSYQRMVLINFAGLDYDHEVPTEEFVENVEAVAMQLANEPNGNLKVAEWVVNELAEHDLNTKALGLAISKAEQKTGIYGLNTPVAPGASSGHVAAPPAPPPAPAPAPAPLGTSDVIRTLMVDWLKQKNFAAAQQHIENMESAGMDVSELRAMFATAQTVLPSVKDPAYETALKEYGDKVDLEGAQRITLNDVRVGDLSGHKVYAAEDLANYVIQNGHWELAQLIVNGIHDANPDIPLAMTQQAIDHVKGGGVPAPVNQIAVETAEVPQSSDAWMEPILSATSDANAQRAIASVNVGELPVDSVRDLAMRLVDKGHMAAAKQIAIKLSWSPHGMAAVDTAVAEINQAIETATQEPPPSKFVLIKGVEVESGSKAERVVNDMEEAALQNRVNATHSTLYGAALKQDAARVESLLHTLEEDGFNPASFDPSNRVVNGIGVTPQDSTEIIGQLSISHHLDSTEATNIGIRLAQAGHTEAAALLSQKALDVGGSGWGTAASSIQKALKQQQPVPIALGAPTAPPEASRLQRISGQQGSNLGGVYQDTATNIRYYVKWPGEERARIEHLANGLYWLAGTSVASTHLVDYTDPSGQGGTGGVAIASVWLDGSSPLSAYAMGHHPAVRAGFLADAWLANWDVVGLEADNIVSTPEGHAVRIDAGGAMMYRAQGAPKPFPGDSVAEFNTLRDPNVNPQSARVFEDMKPEELARSAAMLSSVKDEDIDAAVVKAFGDSEEAYPDDLASILKQRRDVVIGMAAREIATLDGGTVEAAEDRIRNTPASPLPFTAQPTTAPSMGPFEGLSEPSLDLVESAQNDGAYRTSTNSQKLETRREVMDLEVTPGRFPNTAAADADHVVREAFNRWKSDSASKQGQFLRWGIGELDGEGELELKAMRAFLNQVGGSYGDQVTDTVEGLVESPAGAHLVAGLSVTKGINTAMLGFRYPGAETVKVYRTWRDDQASYYELDDRYEGEEHEFEHLPAYSWSLDPNAYSSGSGVVTEAEIPIDWVVLSDRADNSGEYVQEDEVVFRAKNLTVEVTTGGSREEQTLEEYGVYDHDSFDSLANDVEYLINDGQLEMAQNYISTLDQVGYYTGELDQQFSNAVSAKVEAVQGYMSEGDTDSAEATIRELNDLDETNDFDDLAEHAVEEAKGYIAGGDSSTGEALLELVEQLGYSHLAEGISPESFCEACSRFEVARGECGHCGEAKDDYDGDEDDDEEEDGSYPGNRLTAAEKTAAGFVPNPAGGPIWYKPGSEAEDMAKGISADGYQMTLDMIKKLVKEGSANTAHTKVQTLKDWGYEASEFEALLPAPPPAPEAAPEPTPLQSDSPIIPHSQIASTRDAAYALVGITGDEIKAVDRMAGGYGALPLPAGMEEDFVSMGWKLADSGDYQAAETVALFLRQRDHPVSADAVLEYLKEPQPVPAAPGEPVEPEPESNVFDTLTPKQKSDVLAITKNQYSNMGVGPAKVVAMKYANASDTETAEAMLSYVLAKNPKAHVKEIVDKINRVKATAAGAQEGQSEYMKYALAYTSGASGPESAWATMQPMVEKAIEAGDLEAAQMIADHIAHTGYGQMLQSKINVASARQAKAQAAVGQGQEQEIDSQATLPYNESTSPAEGADVSYHMDIAEKFNPNDLLATDMSFGKITAAARKAAEAGDYAAADLIVQKMKGAGWQGMDQVEKVVDEIKKAQAPKAPLPDGGVN